MRFSVIIPNYNHGKYLKKRIESVLNQTYTDFELILLDDHSADHSLAILDSYTDPRITHRIYNKQNSGSPFLQWEKGIEAAQYEHVWIAESDDFCNLDFLETAHRILTDNPEVSLYYCDSHLIGENEEPFFNTVQAYTAELDATLWNSDHKIDGKTYVKNYLSKKNFILNVSSVIFRKDSAIEAVKRIQHFKTSGDWYFHAYILLSGGDVYFHASKQNYFRHSLQSTRNYNTLEKRERRILEKTEIHRFFIENLDYNSVEKKEIVENLISEWIKYHSLKEAFLPSFFTISKFSYLNTSKFELLLKTLSKKLLSRLKK